MPEDARFQGLDLSNMPGILETRETQPFTISPPYISVRTGEPVVLLIQIVPGNGKVVGELKLGMLQDEILNLKGKSDMDFLFIVDQHGTLLAHPQSSRVKERGNLQHLPVVRQGRSETRTFIYDSEGEKVVGTGTRIDPTGWLVVDQVSVYRLGRTYLLTIIEILIASLAIWGVLWWRVRRLLAKRIIRPLETLSRQTATITEEDFHPIDDPSESSDAFMELNQLAMDFKAMISRLQNREKALQESENRYRGLFDRMPIGLFRFNLSGEFTENGQIKLSVRPSPSNKEFIDIAVADTGIGMSDAHVARIFEEFGQADSSTSRNFGGTGLGLTLSKRFAELLGGSIHVASQPGEGSVFTLHLPMISQPLPSPDPATTDS